MRWARGARRHVPHPHRAAAVAGRDLGQARRRAAEFVEAGDHHRRIRKRHRGAYRRLYHAPAPGFRPRPVGLHARNLGPGRQRAHGPRAKAQGLGQQEGQRHREGDPRHLRIRRHDRGHASRARRGCLHHRPARDRYAVSAPPGAAQRLRVLRRRHDRFLPAAANRREPATLARGAVRGRDQPHALQRGSERARTGQRGDVADRSSEQGSPGRERRVEPGNGAGAGGRPEPARRRGGSGESVRGDERCNRLGGDDGAVPGALSQRAMVRDRARNGGGESLWTRAETAAHRDDQGRGRDLQRALLRDPRHSRLQRGRLCAEFFRKTQRPAADRNRRVFGRGRRPAERGALGGRGVVTGWATPCLPYGGDADQGFLFIPEVDAGVWVEFEEGDLEFPIWVGSFWSKPGGDSELPKPNDPDGAEQSDVQDPPTSKIIKTKQGHTLQFEDADGDERITLFEGKNQHVITLNKDGIKVVDGKNSHEIVLDNSGITLTSSKDIVLQASQGKIKLDAKELEVTASTTAKVEATG